MEQFIDDHLDEDNESILTDIIDIFFYVVDIILIMGYLK